MSRTCHVLTWFTTTTPGVYQYTSSVSYLKIGDVVCVERPNVRITE